MNVKLRPETLETIQRRVDSGQFEDADAVVAEGLELIARKERDQLKSLIEAGLEQIARGEIVEWTEDSMAQALERARERSRLGLPSQDYVKP